jgi:hypothetical protein
LGKIDGQPAEISIHGQYPYAEHKLSSMRIVIWPYHAMRTFIAGAAPAFYPHQPDKNSGAAWPEASS